MDDGHPDHLGKYLIRRRLGRGATSEVFQAFDPFRNADVAIKVVDPRVFEDAEDAMVKAGFMVEASLLGKLEHPNVARIFDVVAEPGSHFVVMEYVDGGTLERYCKSGELMDVDSAADVIFKCGKALEFVHGLGIVHRDIKPANILLAGATNAKLTDFGAALSGSVRATRSLRVGTPYYISPEQLEGRDVDFRSDIYSLGVVLYQLLAGKVPFEAGSFNALIQQILTSVPEPPSYYRAQVPRRLDEVALRAMRKDPDERYQSWQQFLDEITHVPDDPEGPPADTPIAAESDRFQLVRHCEFFRSFDDVVIWDVLKVAQFRRVVQGDVLIREGDLGDCFFIVIAGEVRVSRKGRLIDLLSPGACVGELSYVMKGKVARTATCVAMTDGIVLRVSDDWLRGAPENCRRHFESTFLDLIAKRLVDADIRLTDAVLRA